MSAGGASRVKLLAIIAIIGGIAVIIGLVPSVTVLELQDGESEETLHLKEVDNGDEFAIEYVHSQEGATIIMEYRVSSGDIVQTSEQYNYYAAGLAHTGERVTEENMTVVDVEQTHESFTLRVAQYTDQWLIIDGERTTMETYGDQWTTIRFSVQEMNWLEYYVREKVASVTSGNI